MTDENRQSPTGTVSHEVERHPGPFSGPDAELARACAMAVIPWYGNDDATTHQRIIKDGIWNDHIAVQAALAAIHNVRMAAAAPNDDNPRMWKISKLIANLQSVFEQFGDTCVYVRRGGMGWGAVALNREADDEKHGVFNLQAQHDRDMLERLEQIKRLRDRLTEAERQMNMLQRPEAG